MNPRSTFITRQVKRFPIKIFKGLIIWSISLFSAPLFLSLILMKMLPPSPVVTPLAVPSPQPSSKMPSDYQPWLRQLATPSPMATDSPITKTHNPNTQPQSPQKRLSVAKTQAPIQPRPSTTQNIWSQASFPVENFQAYTSGFGWRSLEEGEEFHSGLDIAAPAGSYVRNWWVGQVIAVAEDSFCGTHLVIQSGNWQAVYCHLEGQVSSSPQGNYLSAPDSNITIVQGQWVPTGAPIGRVGITGRTTGPHLHWGVKYAGQWVDPAFVLRAMYAVKTQENFSGRGRS